MDDQKFADKNKRKNRPVAPCECLTDLRLPRFPNLARCDKLLFIISSHSKKASCKIVHQNHPTPCPLGFSFGVGKIYRFQIVQTHLLFVCPTSRTVGKSFNFLDFEVSVPVDFCCLPLSQTTAMFPGVGMIHGGTYRWQLTSALSVLTRITGCGPVNQFLPDFDLFFLCALYCLLALLVVVSHSIRHNK
jgi:hypothetical protein